MYTVIDGNCFKNMLVGAYQLFQKKYEIINQLNVFPVPDGDTGNNMLNTLKSMYSMIAEVSPEEPVGIIAEKASAGAIMGARGNSGVILSQIIHGISRGLHGKKTASCGQMSKAFQYGILYAYRAVTKPVEGTILSVARGIAKGTHDVYRVETDFSKILEASIDAGEEALAKTPEQLQILKDANVVDAGGQGLIVFFEGCLAGLRGQDCEVLSVTPRAKVQIQKGEPLDLEYPYCTEFIVKEANVDKQTVSKALEGMGNSMIVAVVEDIVKVHIHTKHPGDALNMAQTWGTLHDIKVENMRDQHENRLFSADDIQPVKHGVGVLTVAAGDGIAKIMHEMGAAEIISGGQSMNPPVEEFVNAIENGTCEQYIILPNNKNIVLAAEQVRKLLGNSKVAYVPTTNMAQGLSALLHFDATRSMDENTVIMTKEAKETASGSITVAVRDSVVNGISIHEGDYLGILNDKIVCNGSSMEEVLQKMLTDGDYELISLYYGADVTEEQAEKLAAEVEELNDEWEVETFYGGQPLYPILLAME